MIGVIWTNVDLVEETLDIVMATYRHCLKPSIWAQGTQKYMFPTNPQNLFMHDHYTVQVWTLIN